MSVRVAVDELGRFVGAFEWGYLVSLGSDRPQIEAQRVRWSEGHLLLAGVGQTSMANISRKPRVTVMWPPIAAAEVIDGMPEGFTLIVDGDAVIAERAKRTAIRIRPTAAVFHRPAPPWEE